MQVQFLLYNFKNCYFCKYLILTFSHGWIWGGICRCKLSDLVITFLWWSSNWVLLENKSSFTNKTKVLLIKPYLWIIFMKLFFHFTETLIELSWTEVNITLKIIRNFKGVCSSVTQTFGLDTVSATNVISKFHCCLDQNDINLTIHLS